jgi:hypothetical protein
MADGKIGSQELSTQEQRLIAGSRPGEIDVWKTPTKESWPYDAVADSHGDVRPAASTPPRNPAQSDDRGRCSNHLLPRFTNIRACSWTALRLRRRSGSATITARQS